MVKRPATGPSRPSDPRLGPAQDDSPGGLSERADSGALWPTQHWRAERAPESQFRPRPRSRRMVAEILVRWRGFAARQSKSQLSPGCRGFSDSATQRCLHGVDAEGGGRPGCRSAFARVRRMPSSAAQIRSSKHSMAGRPEVRWPPPGMSSLATLNAERFVALRALA